MIETVHLTMLEEILITGSKSDIFASVVGVAEILATLNSLYGHNKHNIGATVL